MVRRTRKGEIEGSETGNAVYNRAIGFLDGSWQTGDSNFYIHLLLILG